MCGIIGGVTSPKIEKINIKESSRKEQPLVSIITPCLNGRKTLPMALASLLAQTYENWEWIFVNDGSTDGSAQFVESINDRRFRIINFEHHRGQAVARQKATDESRGEYVAILDADDWWYSTKPEKQIDFLEKHQYIGLVSAGMMIIGKQEIPVGFRVAQSLNEMTLKILKDPPIAYGPVCMRSEVAKRYPYNPDFKGSIDKDFLQKVCLRERFANMPEPLYVYTEYQSFNWSKNWQSCKYRTIALASFAKQYPLRSAYEIVKRWVKFGVTSALILIGLKNIILARRSKPPTRKMIGIYNREKKIVENMVVKLGLQ